MSPSMPILLYLLKANVALLLFAAAYFGLLRRLTFFNLNRAYLVFALLFAAGYPALPLPALLPAEATPTVVFALVGTTGAAPGAAPAVPVAPAVDWAAVGVALYAAGVAVLLARLLLQLLALWRLRARTRPAVAHGLPVRVLAEAVSPFSFWQTIYLNPALHPAPELAAVLRHEQVHVHQWHTLDVLLGQLVLAAAWCNPAAWLLPRALLDNLEYLADEAVLETGLDRRAYQYSLLRLSHAAAGPSLVSSFTFPTLKNRILMMNAPTSALAQTGRYLLALPLALGLAVGVGAALSPAAAAPAALAAAPGPTVYYLDGKLSDKATVDALNPKSIAFMNVLKEETARQVFGPGTGGVIVVVTKAHENSADVRTLNDKIAKVAPLVPGTETPAEVNVLTPTALAYITKTYPNSRIIGVTKLSYPGTEQVRYKVQLAEGARPHYAYFDEKGNPVKP